MRKIVAPSLALIASAAVVFLAACSKTNDGPVSPGMTLASSTANVGTLIAAVVQVCVDPSSPAGAYTFTASNPTNFQTGDAASTVSITAPGPGPQCGPILTRTPAGSNTQVASIDITASGPGAGTFSYVCTNDLGGVTCGSASGTTAVATGEGESSFHGSTVDFTFVATPPPPPPPPPPAPPLFVIGDVELHNLGANVNFWGAQWWKNNPMSGFVSNGVAGSNKGFAVTQGTCGDTWTSRVGNSPPPPATIPTSFNIIVTSSITKNGPDLTGNIVQILTITQDGGYGPNPGHAGNGVVTAVVCDATER